ncbi:MULTISPECIES: roadblock/LC7 domain-containing protein [Oceanithermus]|uniref:Gliding motility protein n=2 Tax=Oceanithermus desulfurans TaxID=227924 RepID=A0A511RPM2_9DEIN|nr:MULTISPECIES: roadblock/LC7 domain-containing protein [Oceanithermus]MBB6030269.1 putative regulator of Ras-like GTPase activity (Roadblock/LC7/MglB family) [Oceanithermus desulfurans]GEM90882.1 gliding motility protein [Oceanithermus desulfurans NBRC 100063]
MIEPTVALYGDAFNRAASVLEELIDQAQVRYVLLVDRKGFVLAHREALWAPRPPALDSIATLVAGNAAATQALANLLGEPKFNELVKQGEKQGLYVEEVNDLTLLVMIFDTDTPIGRVKLFGKKAAAELDEITRSAVVMPRELGIDKDFHESADAMLDDLFGN